MSAVIEGVVCRAGLWCRNALMGRRALGALPWGRENLPHHPRSRTAAHFKGCAWPRLGLTCVAGWGRAAACSVSQGRGRILLLFLPSLFVFQLLEA